MRRRYRAAMSPPADEPAGDTTTAATTTSWARRVPLVVWLLVLMQACWTLGLTVLYPAFQAPDEVQHIDYVLAHRHGEWLDRPGERHPQVGVLQAYGSVPPTQLVARQADGHQPVPRARRESFDDLGTDQAPASTIPNQMVQHPPLYYGLAAGFTYLVPHFSSLRWDLQVLWLRLFSLLLLLPLPVLMHLTGLRLFGQPRVGLLMALLPFAIPSYLRVGASVNNDALLVLLGAVTMYLVARVMTGDLTRRTAALLGLAWGGMLLTKGQSLVMPPVFAAAYLLGARGLLRERFRRALPPLLLTGAVGAVVGGWWWVRNVVVLGAVQPSGYGPAWPPERLYGARPGASNGEFLHGVAYRLTLRVFGSIGLIDEPRLPYALVLTLFVALVLVVALGLLLGGSVTDAPRLAAITFVAPIALCFGAILVGVHSLYWRTRVFPGIQVRYLVPFAAGMAAPAAVALLRLARRRARWVPLAALSLIALFQLVIVVWLAARQFGTARGSTVHQVDVGLRYVAGWAPWPAAVSVGVALLAGLAAVAVAAELVRQARAEAVRAAT
jgi:4-amino-4-deoxy-L-arabinose transferase-like glycosyltransferase